MSLQLPRFVLFDGSHSIASTDHVVFIRSSADGHLGRFHGLAVVNSPAMDTGVPGASQIRVLSGSMPRSGVAGT